MENGYNAHTIVADELHNHDEIISDEQLFRYKVKLKIKKTMRVYNDMLDKSTTSVVDKMLGNKGFSSVPIKSNLASKTLENEVINKASADEYIDIIDDIVYKQLTGLNRVIIDSRYMEELSINETYSAVRNYLKIKDSNKYVRRTFYRDKFKAEIAFYKKIIKNIKNF